MPDSCFAAFLTDIAAGELDISLDDKLAEVVSAVQTHRKPGKLQFEIVIEPNGEDRVTVHAPKVKTTTPEASLGTTIFFVTPGGRLSRRDPRQPSLEGMEGRR